MKIAVLDWATMSCNGDISPDILSDLGDVSIHLSTSPEETISHIGDAQAVLCNKVQISRKIMDACPDLRYIGLFATGYNNIDIQAAAEKNITVCNAGQYSTDAVAQQVFAYILDYFSRIRDYDELVKKGDWEKSETFSFFPLPTGEIAGKTLSIVGFGSIGRRVAEIGSIFGMKIIVATRTAPTDCTYEITDIRTAVEKADILSFHCPLNEQTQGIVNHELLSRMKPSAVLINTARGGIVNENALADALNSGMISAAYVDVLEHEPMRPDTPLKTAVNCRITPHTAWAALETRQRLIDIVRRSLHGWQHGVPINKVN